MNIILKKKINENLMILFGYLSFCAAYWFDGRNTVAMLASYEPSLFGNPYFCNEIVAFFIGGIIPFLLYELVSRLGLKFSSAGLGDYKSWRYALRYFFIPANLLIFGLKFLYWIFPLINTYMDLIFPFIFYGIAVAMFILFINKYYMAKTLRAQTWYRLGMFFLTAFGIVGILTIILEVL